MYSHDPHRYLTSLETQLLTLEEKLEEYRKRIDIIESGMGIEKISTGSVQAYDPRYVCNSEGHLYRTNTNAAIQDALDDLPATGGWVYLPPIEISIDTTITKTGNGVTLWSLGGIVGASWGGGAILKLADNTNDPVIDFGTAGSTMQYGLRFKGFAIDGNKGNNNSPTSNDNNGLVVHRNSNCWFEDLNIYNVYNDGMQIGDASNIGSKSTINRCLNSTCGDNGINLSGMEEVRMVNNHVGSNGTNQSTARGRSGVSVTSNFAFITDLVSLYDQDGITIRGYVNLLSNLTFDKTYVNPVKCFSTGKTIINGMEVYDGSYTNNNSAMINGDTNSHESLIINDIISDQGSGADRCTYLVGNADYWDTIILGHRDLELINGLFDGYPTTLISEPFEEVLFGPSDQVPADNTTRYTAFDGKHALTTTEADAFQAYNRDKLMYNLKFWLNAAPNGAGKTRTVTMRESGASSTLTATASNTDTDAADSTHKVAVAAGNTVEWRLTAANAPDASHLWGSAYVCDLELVA